MKMSVPTVLIWQNVKALIILRSIIVIETYEYAKWWRKNELVFLFYDVRQWWRRCKRPNASLSKYAD